MIVYRQIDSSFFGLYDKIPMKVNVNSEYVIEKINGGLGGILLKEVPVKEYIKDLGIYEEATKYEEDFDISNWKFFIL